MSIQWMWCSCCQPSPLRAGTGNPRWKAVGPFTLRNKQKILFLAVRGRKGRQTTDSLPQSQAPSKSPASHTTFLSHPRKVHFWSCILQMLATALRREAHQTKIAAIIFPSVGLVGGRCGKISLSAGVTAGQCLLSSAYCHVPHKTQKRPSLYWKKYLAYLEHMLTPVAFQRLCKFQLTLLSNFPFRDTARGIWQTMK